MLEIEMKFPVPEFSTVMTQLQQWGPGDPIHRQEVDHYFNKPAYRDFARTDEALRVRQVGSANFVTYKGPKRDGGTKTRTEIEVGLAKGDQAAQDFRRILAHLGYEPVAVVRKDRRIYHFDRGGFHLEVCLDDVEGVGTFAELEIQAPEDGLEPARTALLQAAADLRLQPSERRSYLELLLSKRGQ
jgi:adenylate cyclase class 2